MQGALEALPSIGDGGVSVHGPNGGPWTVEFIASLADTEILPLKIVESKLSGGTETAAVNAIQDGGSFEVCTPAKGDICEAGQAGYRAGEIFHPQGIAIDAAGNVYVDEPTTGGAGEEPSYRVQKFDSEGRFLLMLGGEVNKTTGEDVCTVAQQEGGDVCGVGVPGKDQASFKSTPSRGATIAVGPEGNLFAGDVERILEFDPSGAFADEVKVPGETIQSLAMDSGGNFYVTLAEGFANSKADVHKLGPSGAPLNVAFSAISPRAVAVDAAGDVFAIDNVVGSQERVREFKADGTQILPTKEEEDEDKKAEEEGTSFKVFLETNSFAGFQWTGLATGSGCGIAGSDLYVLGVNRTDHESVLRAYGSPPDPTVCDPPKAPPTIVSQYATSADSDGATLKAQINPRFWPDTTYRVEYGTGKCSEGGCPSSTASSLLGQAVNANVTTTGVTLIGLQANTTYHYRFVSQSSGGGPTTGVGAGEEATFTTPAVPVPPPNPDLCANASFRAGRSASLPDCRAYEMVSPVEKNNADVFALFNSIGDRADFDQSAVSGEKITYSVARAFGDSQSAPYTSQYIASRDPQGWSSHSISPPRGLSITGNASLDSSFTAFSPDLCDAWLSHDTDPPLAEGAAEGFANLYRRRNCGEEGYEAITTAKPPTPETIPATYEPRLQGVSADGSRAVFRAGAKLTANAASGVKQQCYEAFAGKLRLVSLLPAGPPSKLDCSIGSDNAGIRQGSLSHAVSDDGSRIFWTAGAAVSAGQVFVRIDGKNPTVAVSEAGEALSGVSQESRFLTASPDGSKAIYSTGSISAGKADLYEFVVDSKSTHLIAHRFKGLLGAGDDASRIYFVSEEALGGLNAEGRSAAGGEPNLYLHEAGGGLTFIGTLSTADVLLSGGTAKSPVSLEPRNHAARVSPDGEHAAFLSTGSPTGFDNTDANSGEPDAEVYVYDAQAQSLHCVSCDPSGIRPSGREVAEGINAGVGLWAAALIPGQYQLYGSRPLSTDGRRLFFESFEALVPHDSNRTLDVYEWEAPGAGSCEESSPAYSAPSGGCLSLISSGQSSAASEFIDASVDGSDVFIRTGQSLVGQDQGLIDLYDARVGGGFPLPQGPPAACEGEACQSPSAPPNDPTAASASFEGGGNLVEERNARCPKGKLRRKGRCRAKRHKVHHGRHARGR